MENIGGIFVVLICGLIIAVFVAIMEFVWSTRRTAETDEVHHRTHTHTHLQITLGRREHCRASVH